MKKYLSLLLVSVFCLTAFFGCGKNVKPGDIDGYDEGEKYSTSISTASISRTSSSFREMTAAEDIQTK